MNTSDLIIRPMRREELDILVDWAANEGWNPGLSDADIFWETDPQAFIAAELSGQLIGGGSIVSYSGQYGFMGFFIIHPDHRSQGMGKQLWDERLRRLKMRLDHSATIGMDGVFDMQAFYTRGGFEFAMRDLRFEGTGQLFDDRINVINVSDIPFETIDAYDRVHFPAPRPGFLRRWFNQPGGFAKAALHENTLAGFAVMRPCKTGYKIGPLFANNATIANDLFCSLSTQVPGKSLFLDIPEHNAKAMQLVIQHNMTEVFGCAKMFYGPQPDLPISEIFGVTTFEFG